MSTLLFETKLSKIGNWTIIRLPKNISEKLPSRGMTMIKGSINNFPLTTPLEPDGMGSHWFRVNDSLIKMANLDPNSSVSL